MAATSSGVIAAPSGVDADDEAERLDVVGQVRQREPGLFARVQIGQMEGLEVADHDVAWELVVLQARKVVEGLGAGAVEITASRLVLNQQLAFPEQVDETLAVAQLLDRLLEGGDQAAFDAEDLEEVVVEGLRVAPLVAGEVRRPGAYLIQLRRIAVSPGARM